MRTLYPFNTFATSLHPPRFQLATRFIDYILAATITVFPKFSKKMSERKSIGALFNSDLFLSRIKSDRVFETVISRAQRPGQKGFRRLFSIYSLFVPRRGGGEHLPFPVGLFLPRQAASQNFIFPEQREKLSFDRNKNLSLLLYFISTEEDFRVLKIFPNSLSLSLPLSVEQNRNSRRNNPEEDRRNNIPTSRISAI